MVAPSALFRANRRTFPRTRTPAKNVRVLGERTRTPPYNTAKKPMLLSDLFHETLKDNRSTIRAPRGSWNGRRLRAAIGPLAGRSWRSRRRSWGYRRERFSAAAASGCPCFGRKSFPVSLCSHNERVIVFAAQKPSVTVFAMVDLSLAA
jgi:hypothetical protein